LEGAWSLRAYCGLNRRPFRSRQETNMNGNWLTRLLSSLLGKLPLHRLSPRMTYSLAFNSLLLLFMTILYSTGTQINGFPNAWDFRFMLAVNVAVFMLGIINMWTRK